MPWTHCGDSITDDLEECPACGIKKADWTLFFNRTRTFTIARKKKAQLKIRLWDEEEEDVLGEVAYKILSLDAGTVLDEAKLDGEGFVTVKKDGLPQMVLVEFPDELAGCIVPLSKYKPEEITPGRFACMASELWEFRRVEVWLEIELADDQDKRVGGVKYVLTLPDGETTREGTLDEYGFAREEKLPVGECQVSFPDFDGSAWDLGADSTDASRERAPEDEGSEADEAAVANEPTWIEIELEDDTGEPAAGVRYSVILPDRKIQEGTLDEKGFARLDLAGVPAGECSVSFPDLDASVWALS